MTRQELVKRVEDRIGVKVPVSVLVYCRQRGIVTVRSSKRLGWLDYPDKAVDQLVAYCQTRSRLFASVSSSQASGK